MIHGQDHTLVLAVLISVVNFAFHIFSSFTYLDAELDDRDFMKLYRRLNICIVPEAAVHGFLAMLLLINGFWSGFFLNLPVLGWNIKKALHNDPPPDEAGLSRKVGIQMRESLTKLIFHCLMTFYYMNGILRSTYSFGRVPYQSYQSYQSHSFSP